MTLKLYTNYSDKNHVDKHIIQQGTDMSGTLREDCSIVDPVIKIQSITGFNISTCNYAYISEFGRYYYITNIVCVGKLYELHMHCDVLMSFRSQIRSNSAVVSRQENKYNLYLQDGVFKTYANPHYEIKKFPGGFSGYHFVFSVAGG